MDEAKMPARQGGALARMSVRLAIETSQNDIIRAFAPVEVAEKRAVRRAFGAEGAEVPLREDHGRMLERLSALEGAEFDRTRLDGQLAGHEDLRGIHADYAGSGEDPVARGAATVGVAGVAPRLVTL